MSVALPSTSHVPRLDELLVGEIDRNPKNPRIHFTEDELERLAQSISGVGILVPVVVFEDGNRFRLIDGERRWLCAQTLGLEKIPAVVTSAVDDQQNLLRMFNIHLVREPWRDMPTAWALQELMQSSGVTGTRDLADLTGLSTDRLERLKHALELPEEYQRYIDAGTIPLNFFWELKKNVIDPLARRRPVLWQEFGEDQVLEAFVAKRLGGIVTDTVSLRKVLSIITVASRDAGAAEGASVLDDTLRRLISQQEFTVDDAYQESVELIVETDKLERRTNNLIRSIERLLSRAQGPDERERVNVIVRSLLERVRGLLG